MELILILLVVFFIWPIIKVLWRVKKAQNDMRNFYRQAAQQAQKEEKRRQAAQQPPKPRKVFTREDGEYVEFEEIASVKESAGHAATSETYSHSIHIESQITDVEWEDL